MEKLYAEFLLLLNELNTNEKYESLLYEYFLNASNDKVLFDLEELLRIYSERMLYWENIGDLIYEKAFDFYH